MLQVGLHGCSAKFLENGGGCVRTVVPGVGEESGQLHTVQVEL